MSIVWSGSCDWMADVALRLNSERWRYASKAPTATSGSAMRDMPAALDEAEAPFFVRFAALTAPALAEDVAVGVNRIVTDPVDMTVVEAADAVVVNSEIVAEPGAGVGVADGSAGEVGVMVGVSKSDSNDVVLFGGLPCELTSAAKPKRHKGRCSPIDDNLRGGIQRDGRPRTGDCE